MKNKFILGIAGYMCSGKSTVGKYFQDKGFFFIDADKVVNDLYEPGKDGYLKIANFFGEKYLKKNGQIDRKKLAKFVFSDPNKVKILNHLIHPLVVNEIQKLVDSTDKKMIVVEAIDFDEKNLGRIVDKVLWIDCDLTTLLERALNRTNMNPELFKKILKTQRKPSKIDYSVENNGSETDLFNRLNSAIFELK